MADNLKNITLESTIDGETWGGFTLTVDFSDDTKFASALSLVRMTWKNTDGSVTQTLTSEAAGEITINTATAYAWSFTLEPRILDLEPGSYSWAVEVTDDDDVIDKDYMSGTHEIQPDPHA